jgi:hypothetical protein
MACGELPPGRLDVGDTRGRLSVVTVEPAVVEVITTTTEAVAERIGADPGELGLLLADEARRGHVARDEAGRWHLLPSGFAPDVLEALRQLRPG